MKKYTNLVLLSLLAALLYKTPRFLIESVSSNMGKLTWIIIIAIFNFMMDSVSAIILAVIMITLLHQSTVEGFENDKEKKEKKTEKEQFEEMEKKEDEEAEEEDEEEDEEDDEIEAENSEEDNEDGKEGFEVISKTEKKCEKYNEGFSGFTEMLKKLRIPVTNTNTTDLDRDIKASAERSTLKSTMEFYN
jgi:hypothetical protein